jgi:CAAX protease family protein
VNGQPDESGRSSDAPVQPRLPAAARVFLFLPAYLLAQVLLQGGVLVVALAVAGGAIPGDESAVYAWLIAHPVILAGMTWSTLLVVLGVTAFFVRVVDRRPVVSLGFQQRPAAPAQCMVGFALGGALLATVFGVGRLLGWYRVAAVLPPDRALVLVAAALVILLPMAAAEEIALRGYVLQALEARYGPRWALGISAVIFALCHAGNPNAGWPAYLGITVAGLYLGAAYLWTGRLWLPIAAHTAWNLCEGPVFGLPLSGIYIPDTVLQTEASGPPLWTGGAFGPEAGLLLTGVILAHLALLAWATRSFRPPVTDVLSADKNTGHPCHLGRTRTWTGVPSWIPRTPLSMSCARPRRGRREVYR